MDLMGLDKDDRETSVSEECPQQTLDSETSENNQSGSTVDSLQAKAKHRKVRNTSSKGLESKLSSNSLIENRLLLESRKLECIKHVKAVEKRRQDLINKKKERCRELLEMKEKRYKEFVGSSLPQASPWALMTKRSCNETTKEAIEKLKRKNERLHMKRMFVKRVKNHCNLDVFTKNNTSMEEYYVSDHKASTSFNQSDQPTSNLPNTSSARSDIKTAHARTPTCSESTSMTSSSDHDAADLLTSEDISADQEQVSEFEILVLNDEPADEETSEQEASSSSDNNHGSDLSLQRNVSRFKVLIKPDSKIEVRIQGQPDGQRISCNVLTKDFNPICQVQLNRITRGTCDQREDFEGVETTGNKAFEKDDEMYKILARNLPSPAPYRCSSKDYIDEQLLLDNNPLSGCSSASMSIRGLDSRGSLVYGEELDTKRWRQEIRETIEPTFNEPIISFPRIDDVSTLNTREDSQNIPNGEATNSVSSEKDKTTKSDPSTEMYDCLSDLEFSEDAEKDQDSISLKSTTLSSYGVDLSIGATAESKCSLPHLGGELKNMDYSQSEQLSCVTNRNPDLITKQCIGKEIQVNNFSSRIDKQTHTDQFPNSGIHSRNISTFLANSSESKSNELSSKMSNTALSMTESGTSQTISEIVQLQDQLLQQYTDDNKMSRVPRKMSSFLNKLEECPYKPKENLPEHQCHLDQNSQNHQYISSQHSEAFIRRRNEILSQPDDYHFLRPNLSRNVSAFQAQYNAPTCNEGPNESNTNDEQIDQNEHSSMVGELSVGDLTNILKQQQHNQNEWSENSCNAKSSDVTESYNDDDLIATANSLSADLLDICDDINQISLAYQERPTPTFNDTTILPTCTTSESNLRRLENSSIASVKPSQVYHSSTNSNHTVITNSRTLH